MAWFGAHGLSFDEVYIEKPGEPGASAPSVLLLYRLRQDSRYQLVFENAEVAIFRLK